jgi:hypothetical protein
MQTQVDIYMPIEKHGRKVAEYLVSVRPKDDAALGGIIGASDVFYEDDEGDRHPMSQQDAEATLKEIKKFMPEEWAEIEAAAEAEWLEGADSDDLNVYAA